MLLAIESVLDPVQTSVLGKAAAALVFEDGGKTAGRFARAVKANDQATATPERDAVLAQVAQALAGNALFRSAARPKALTPLIV